MNAELSEEKMITQELCRGIEGHSEGGSGRGEGEIGRGVVWLGARNVATSF